MVDLLKKEQDINFVPQDFKSAGKGKVINSKDNCFYVELNFQPKNVSVGKLSEFYCSTENGILYFEAKITGIEGKVLTVNNPVKHRYLQRRQFSRINFVQDLVFSSDDKKIRAKTLDLSAGGMKIQSNESFNIDKEYAGVIKLPGDNELQCIFEPIRIEKTDDKTYTVSGSFKNLSNIAKMTLVQLCMRKNLENISK